jgi:hypothetical protein
MAKQPLPKGFEIVPQAHPAPWFTRRNVQPPSSAYITPQDVLVIRSRNSVGGQVLTITARILNPSGQEIVSQWTHTPNGSRSLKVEAFPLVYGYLLGVSVSVSVSTTRRGQTYVALSLGVGSALTFVEMQTLIAHYVTAFQPIGWPGVAFEAPTSGRGFVFRANQTPALGSPAQFTVPTAALWHILSVSCSLVASATVANRLATLSVDLGLFIQDITQSETVQTASTTIVYHYAAGIGPLTRVQSTENVGFGQELWLKGGDVLLVDWNNLQANDQADASLMYEELLSEV